MFGALLRPETAAFRVDWLLAGAVALAALWLGAELGWSGPGADPSAPRKVAILTPRGATIFAEVADTAEKRARGLMFREALRKDRGMLFTFADAQPWSFWMKNTKIRLDIIWLDGNKKIVHVERNVPVCTRTDDGCPNYQPNEPALYVLEVAAGVADELRLQRGVKLKFTVPPS